MLRSVLTQSLSVILLLCTGCSSHNHEGNQNKEITGNSIRQSAPYPVELLDQKGLARLISERNGKTLLLNIWATWCQPCVEEFPDLIKLAQTDTSIEVIGISVDYPDEIHSKVAPFLEKLKVPFKVYIAKFEKQEDFITAIDTAWSGAIPSTSIYDRRGRKRFSRIGLGTYDLFEKKIQEIRTN